MSLDPCPPGYHEEGPVGDCIRDAVPPRAEDFRGFVDGGGVKQSLTTPKLPLNLIPPQFTECVADVLAFGARKYAKHNWMRGMSFEEILSGIERHQKAIRRG